VPVCSGSGQRQKTPKLKIEVDIEDDIGPGGAGEQAAGLPPNVLAVVAPHALVMIAWTIQPAAAEMFHRAGQPKVA
jgi:hypothetical protein